MTEKLNRDKKYVLFLDKFSCNFWPVRRSLVNTKIGKHLALFFVVVMKWFSTDLRKVTYDLSYTFFFHAKN